MKQTTNNQNFTPLEMGLMSITGYLKHLNEKTDESLKLFNSLVDDNKEFNGSFISMIKGVSMRRFIVSQNLQLKSISNIDKNLTELLKFLKTKDTDGPIRGILKIVTPKEHKEKFERMSVKQSLSGIMGGIFNKGIQYLFASKGASENLKNVPKTNQILMNILSELKSITGSDEGNENTKRSLFDITNLAKAVVTLDKKLTRKFFKSMDTLSQKLEKLLSFDAKKVDAFDTNMTKFTKVLGTLESKLKPASLSLALFAGAFLLLSFVAISPLLGVALLMLTGFMWTLTKVFKNEPKLPKDLQWFAMGIGILTLAMFAMNEVSWTSPIMMLAFIGGLGLVFKLYSSKVSLPKQMIEFATGIGILTLAMFAMNYIDVGSLFKMLAFIGGLGLVFKLFGNTKSTLGQQVRDFSFGIGILTLSLLAMQFVEWKSIGKLLLFIGGLALELALINKIGGSSPMSGMVGFAFGIGILVLAMYAMKELPWWALAEMVLFVAGLGLSLKLYDGKSGMMMLGIGAGILMISAGLWVYKKTNFTLQDGLTLAGTILLLGLAFTLIGKLGSKAIIGAIVVAAIGAATAIAYGLLALVSKLEINYENMLVFGAVIGVLTAAYSVGISSGILILAVAGAAVTTVMVALTLVSALALLLITQFKIDISSFNTGIYDLTMTMMKIAVPAVVGLVGAALAIPLTALALVSAVFLSAISNKQINAENITKYTVGLKGLVDGINEIGIIAAGKAGIKAALLIPLVKSLQMLTNIKVRTKQEIDLFRTSTLSAIDVLGAVMAKMDKWDYDNAEDNIPLLSDFLSAFNSVDIMGISTISSAMSNLMNTLADNNKWKLINQNLSNLAVNFRNVSASINMLNLEKALAFERTLKVLTEDKNSEVFAKVIEKLQEMINLLYSKAEPTTTVVQQTGKQEPTKQKETDLVETIQNMINNLNEQLTGVNDKLTGKLKVMLVDGNSNKF